MREAVFSSLGRHVRNSVVLDLFAGVGGYGLDALSRGADACIFVEKNSIASEAIEKNIKNVQKSSNRKFSTKVFCNDVFSWAETLDTQFDIIFIDPPYNMIEQRGNDLLAMFSKHLKENEISRLIIEVPGKYDLETPEDLILIKRLGRQGNSRQPNALIYGKMF
jgi:16S rRNA (guanine966-N2)-methyltransferase